MPLINQDNSDANWREVLSLWESIGNWGHYNASEAQLEQQIKMLLVFLWSEKEWLKKEYPKKTKAIEHSIDKCTLMRAAIDIANTVKHRRLTKATRINAVDTKFKGRVTLSETDLAPDFRIP